MLFVFHGIDRPDASALRAEHAAAHRDHQAGRSNPVGGPILDVAQQPCGTLIIFEAPDRVAAEALMADDPYVRAGLFANASIHEFVAVDWPT